MRAPDDIRSFVDWGRLLRPGAMWLVMLIVLSAVVMQGQGPEPEARGAGVQLGGHVVGRAIGIAQQVGPSPK
jgi:hypothetical protein